MGTLVLLDMMGGVALLLWGLHMVQSGILRAFGSDLRHFLAHAVGNRFAAFFAGLGLTALLQRSTATGLMTASFAAQGMVALVPALAIMLGANVGTTLIVQLLSFDVSAVAPAALRHRAGRLAARRRLAHQGHRPHRHRLRAGAARPALPDRDTGAGRERAGPAYAARRDHRRPVLCIVLAAAFTWAAHSSVATVLLVMSLGLSHFVTPEAAIALVLGANLGSAINPVLEGGKRDQPASYRLPVGNFLNRLVGVVLAVPLLGPIARPPANPPAGPGAHGGRVPHRLQCGAGGPSSSAFSIRSRACSSPAAGARQTGDPAAPRYLDEGALDTPSLALADAARETLHMGDVVETMLRKIMAALITNDRALVAEVSRMDDSVDQLDEAIKLYVTKLTRGSLDEREGRRAMEIISFSINLEHIGDIIDKNLSELAAKKISHKLHFSEEGADEIAAFHRRIVESLRIALGVFMSGDVSRRAG